MKLMRGLLAVVAACLLVGCGGKGTQSQATSTPAQTDAAQPATPPQGDGHAVAGAVPGSYSEITAPPLAIIEWTNLMFTLG